MWNYFLQVIVGILACLWLNMVTISALDLSRATVITPIELTRLEKKAVTLLVEEVEKRSQIRWEVRTDVQDSSAPAIILGQSNQLKEIAGFKNEASTNHGAEGFRISVASNAPRSSVTVVGNDPRGVLYGVGYLLRQLHMAPGRISVADDLSISAAPRYPLRGHQLGYRPKTHSYDAWNLATWEQYYRDLIVFGANAVELVPPRTDDDADSPHFPLPPLQMMTGMSQLADDYGLDVWIWYPAMDKDYSDPKTVESAIKEWAEVFKRLPRIDAVFVPGGDPGHTAPKILMALLEKQTESLHRTHPKAQMWVSPQSFNREWLDEFLGILKEDHPDWLTGIVFGPQVRISLPELRAAVPKKYPIRHYPDITHTRQCQYPVPDWDTAFAITEGRECINPRPVDEAAIIHLLQPATVGFISYSEGCNDDVNKAVWSALSWDPESSIIDVLREFSRYFIGDNYTEDFAQGLLALERNWRGPLIANDGVNTTLRQFQDMERTAKPSAKTNWRFQQALFRAYYDAYTRDRLVYETALENRAMDDLRAAERLGSRKALQSAEAILNRALTEFAAPDLRARTFELGEALFQSIRMQLSVPRYQAIGVDRGASLDTIDYSLNNRRWLTEQFGDIRRLKTEAERLQAIDQVVNWTNPGPGGFYDDTGNIVRQPHVIRGLTFEKDPASLVSSKVGFEEGDVVDEPDEKPEAAMRISWLDHAESMIDQPLRMRYENLDQGAQYKIRVTYAGDAPKRSIRLVANNQYEIHPLIKKEFPYRPVEFDIPLGATREGTLELSWFREQGLGGNGRGCQVSEVWLIKK
ncbi:MAG: hypothetical protein JWM99_1281 [Verrucomicrobiales bacterium]|nr:hypothetical protein [Verrucomicrobiales bacterium]